MLIPLMQSPRRLMQPGSLIQVFCSGTSQVCTWTALLYLHSVKVEMHIGSCEGQKYEWKTNGCAEALRSVSVVSVPAVVLLHFRALHPRLPCVNIGIRSDMSFQIRA